jgi:peptidoglycan hydrolase-like protein with peptidoglycan-binding domain
MIIRLGVVSFVFVAACHSPPPVPATTTTNYLMVKQGRRVWPLHDQALVRNVEERLEAQGFDPGHLDGIADERTTQALHAFQKSRNLPATGVLDEATAEALGLRWRAVRNLVRAGRLDPF